MAEIRPYRTGDRDAVYEICLTTGKAGEDATGWLDDDDLLPDIYALPYVDFEPDGAFVVDVDGLARGYILGVPDTSSFVETLRSRWLPSFQRKYPLTGEDTVSQWFVRDGRDIDRLLIPELDEFPAHLHIDLMPELQGHGFGRRLIRTLLKRLSARGAAGVWLEYGQDNVNAAAFYRRIGFTPMPTSELGTRVALRTDARV